MDRDFASLTYDEKKALQERTQKYDREAMNLDSMIPGLYDNSKGVGAAPLRRMGVKQTDRPLRQSLDLATTGHSILNSSRPGIHPSQTLETIQNKRSGSPLPNDTKELMINMKYHSYNPISNPISGYQAPEFYKKKLMQAEHSNLKL